MYFAVKLDGIGVKRYRSKERNEIAWLKVGIWEMRSIRRGFEKVRAHHRRGSCYTH